MIVALTGTPGTGKTTVAEHLEEFEVAHLTEFAERHEIGEEVNGEWEIPVEELDGELAIHLSEEKDYLVEGHLAHRVTSDLCVVLRTHPDELEKRLNQREYSDRKIMDNVESERIDVILQEAVQENEIVIEIDTTHLSVEETVQRLRSKIKKGESDFGGVDWIESI